jgi:hypothetical protein
VSHSLEKEKIRRENNPVLEQARRAAIRAEQKAREEAAMGTETPIPLIIEKAPSEAPQEAITAPATVSPDMERVTREAAENALRQSTRSQAQGELDAMMRPLEPVASYHSVRPVLAPNS